MPPADRTLPLLLHYLHQHWLSYSLGVVAIICTNWIAVSIPHYIQVSIDLLGADFSNQQQRLTDNLLIMLALAVCMIVVRTLSRILFFNPGRTIECQVKNDMFHKLMALQKGYYDQNPSGGIISKVNNDITGIRMICGFAMMQAFNIITMLSLTPLTTSFVVPSRAPWPDFCWGLPLGRRFREIERDGAFVVHRLSTARAGLNVQRFLVGRPRQFMDDIDEAIAIIAVEAV